MFIILLLWPILLSDKKFIWFNAETMNIKICPMVIQSDNKNQILLGLNGHPIIKWIEIVKEFNFSHLQHIYLRFKFWGDFWKQWNLLFIVFPQKLPNTCSLISSEHCTFVDSILITTWIVSATSGKIQNGSQKEAMLQ